MGDLWAEKAKDLPFGHLIHACVEYEPHKRPSASDFGEHAPADFRGTLLIGVCQNAECTRANMLVTNKLPRGTGYRFGRDGLTCEHCDGDCLELTLNFRR